MSEVLSSSSPSQGLPDCNHWGIETEVPEGGAEVGVEQRGLNGRAGGGAENAPVDDVADGPSSDHSRQRRFAHLAGLSPLVRHDGSPGTSYRLRECHSQILVLFLVCPGFSVLFPPPCLFSLTLLAAPGRGGAREAFRPALSLVLRIYMFITAATTVNLKHVSFHSLDFKTSRKPGAD